MSACVPLVDIYLASDVGYQKVRGEQTITITDPNDATNTTQDKIIYKGDGVVYGGALGVGLSAFRLYAGGELNLAYTSFDTDIQELGDNGRVEEKWILGAFADGGVYVQKDVLVFGRIGYIYVDSDFDNQSNIEGLKDELSALAFGGGVEYEVGLGLGVRAYYLYHEGRREAHDIRAGIIWRF